MMHPILQDQENLSYAYTVEYEHVEVEDENVL
jgi:hypothetical protein